MVTIIKRFLQNFFRKSRSVNDKPLNFLSLIVVIAIDLFILFNVFAGLDNISRWHLSPTETYPCVSTWKSYRESKEPNNRDYAVISSALNSDNKEPGYTLTHPNVQQDRLGQVSPICSNYTALQKQVNIPENRQIQQSIQQKQTKIAILERTNGDIRSQYDSTLLEKIAGQNTNQSINSVKAEEAKKNLEKNKVTIANLKTEITTLQDGLIKKPESTNLINLVKDNSKYQVLNEGYKKSSFWYPSIRLGFQALFLLPLIVIAFLVHQFALRRRAGLIALISWHLLAIFFIPLLLKIFEFLQIGVLFEFLLRIVTKLFGGLLFLVNYFYIFLIPLVGFGIIRFLQRFTPSNKPLETKETIRFQNQLCLSCAKKIRPQDPYCPHCGHGQYTECHNCHELTYQHLSHCKQCGQPQEPHQEMLLSNS